VVAVLVVETPFAVWFVGVYQFANTFQTVEVMLGFGKCPTCFQQDTAATSIVQGVGSHFTAYRHLQATAVPVIDKGGEYIVNQGGSEIPRWS
jgi:hypothetical protein